MSIPTRSRARRAGFALVDVSIAIAILAVALGTLIGTVFYALRLEQANEETAAASQLMRSMLERIQARPFESIYASYNASKDDDPDAGVDHLAELVIDDPLLTLGKREGPAVRVRFPGDEGGELREDVADDALGMPRDLNGDDALDGLDHSGDYRVLPLTLELAWEGASGPRTLEMSAWLRSR